MIKYSIFLITLITWVLLVLISQARQPFFFPRLRKIKLKKKRSGPRDYQQWNRHSERGQTFQQGSSYSVFSQPLYKGQEVVSIMFSVATHT